MLLKSVIALLAGFGVFIPVIFWPAGTLNWPQGWLYFGVVSLNFLINFVYLWRVNRSLIAHRMTVGPGTKHWDIVWGIVFGPLFLSIYIVAGFDAVRYEWTHMARDWWWFGLLLHVPGALLFTWSMGVNPFFEKTVRIQTERGHKVIDAGPYGFVRHPGYLGFVGWGISVPFFLGSWWALVPAILSVGGIVVRTALEDITLHEELEGYQSYASRVRYRLIPGIW